MRGILVTIMIWGAAFVAKAQDFEYVKPVSNVKATVKILGDNETSLIVPDDNPNMRYISQQLPEEYKKDGLRITFNGIIGKIPPNVRMLGTPLKIEKVWVSSKDCKKFKLKRCKYRFK